MQEALKQLIKQKDQIQVKIMGLNAQIKAINDAKNMQKGTVDSQGFPRQDLDFGELANYRNLKRRRAELNNDHFALMKEVQKNLHSLHTSFPDLQEGQQKQVMPSPFSKKKQEIQQIVGEKEKDKDKEKEKVKEIEKQTIKKQYIIDYLTPFAKISAIQVQSPVYKYGIRLDDLLSQFSQVNIYTIDNVKQIPHYVKEGIPIKIKVLRKIQIHNSSNNQQELKKQNVFKLKDSNYYQKIECDVTPEKWIGKGLLGCKIDPIK